MDELSLDDVHQLYESSVVVYKGKLVYVDEVYRHEDNTIYLQIMYLGDRKKEAIPFVRTELKAPSRIGYVNYRNAAWFISRTPARMFKIGITDQNIKIEATHGFRNFAVPRVHQECYQDAHDSNYPSLYKAWLSVKMEAKACCAFDHQFAICNERSIYYKGKIVGHIPKGHVRRTNIVWNKGYEYLADVLEPDYEKTVRTFA